jgi:hypothetical protein
MRQGFTSIFKPHIVAAALSLAMSIPAEASTIQYGFTGTVTSSDAQMGAGFKVGDTVVGSFAYDDAGAPGLQPAGSSGLSVRDPSAGGSLGGLVSFIDFSTTNPSGTTFALSGSVPFAPGSHLSSSFSLSFAGPGTFVTSSLSQVAPFLTTNPSGQLNITWATCCGTTIGGIQATPTPEPSTLMLTAVALSVVAAAKQRRRA